LLPPRPPRRGLALRLTIWSILTLSSPAWGAHGVALFGKPKYSSDYQSFDYVNPDAPKGGTLNLSIVAQNSSFDKFNPFSLKGKPAPGLLELMFETLTINGL